MSKSLIASDKQACDKNVYEITKADLPLSCPMQDSRVWDAHPRVYLPVADVGRVICPYCSAVYVLKDFSPADLPPQPIPE